MLHLSFSTSSVSLIASPAHFILPQFPGQHVGMVSHRNFCTLSSSPVGCRECLGCCSVFHAASQHTQQGMKVILHQLMCLCMVKILWFESSRNKIGLRICEHLSCCKLWDVLSLRASSFLGENLFNKYHRSIFKIFACQH